MHHLRNTDPYLDMTDIMITSQVLSDPNSKFFFTPDLQLTQSRKLSMRNACEKTKSGRQS